MIDARERVEVKWEHKKERFKKIKRSYLSALSVSLLSGVTQVESQVFTRVSLHTRKLNTRVELLRQHTDN